MATDNIYYTFDNDTIFDENAPFSNTTFNMRNSYNYTQDYNATYSFENDDDGSNPQYWTLYEPDNINIEVINYIDSHNKVLEFKDYGVNYGLATQYFDYQTCGIIEFWCRINNTNQGIVIYALKDDSQTIFFEFNLAGFFRYYDGSSYIEIMAYNINEWYHIRWTDIDCINFEYDIYINNILKVKNAGFKTDNNSINAFRVYTGGNANLFHLDALGYSWDSNYSTYVNYDTRIDTIDPNDDMGINQWQTTGGTGDHYTRLIDDLDTTRLYVDDTDVDKKEQFDIETTSLPYMDFLGKVNVRLRTSGTAIDIADIKIRFGGEGSWSEPMYIILEATIEWQNHIFDNLFITSQSDIDTFQVELDSNTIPSAKYTRVYEMEIIINMTHYDSYSENMIPIIDYNNITEVDKCEFAYNITNYEPNETEYATINNDWSETDYDNEHVKTSIESEGEISIYYLETTGYQFGINKEFGYSGIGIYNITLIVNKIDFYANTKGFNFNIYTYDDTLLVRLRIILNYPIINIYYYDGSSYIYLYSMKDQYHNDLILNIYIDSFCILELTEVSEFYNVYYFPKLTNKTGINTIEFIGDTLTEDTMDIYIKSIGVYINGSSYKPDDLSSITINTNIDYWNDDTHNMFYINADGSLSFSVEYDGVIDEKIFPLTYFNNELKVFYYTESKIFKGHGVYSFLLLTNSSYQINMIKIGAIVLKQDINKYFMEFDYGNVDITENYFYVDDNNYLRFYIDFNDENTEYIQATFDINNVSSTNHSVSFRNCYSGYMIPYLCLQYTDTSYTYYDFKYNPSTTNYLIKQAVFVDKFIINVSDCIPNFYDYSETDIGFTYGYITLLKFIYIRDIELTFITISLINGIIPLIIMLLPTIALRIKFGNKVVVPVLIIMTILCVVMFLIPVWLFSILLIIYGYLILINRKELN